MADWIGLVIYPLIGSAFIFIIWNLRHESKTASNEKDIRRLERENTEFRQYVFKQVEDIKAQHNALDSKLMEKLSEIQLSIARLQALFEKEK